MQSTPQFPRMLITRDGHFVPSRPIISSRHFTIHITRTGAYYYERHGRDAVFIGTHPADIGRVIQHARFAVQEN